MGSQIRHSYPFRYKGSVLWPILFALIYPPICILLVAKNLSFVRNDTTFHLSYHGSWFWISFWAIVFFPIGILLLCFNGADVVETTLFE